MPGAKRYKVILETPEGEVILSVGWNEYLLDAAAHAGLSLPHTCLQGWCITCAGRLLEGEVDQSEAFRFFPEDARAGFVLLCSARPRSDLRIRTHQKKEMREHRRRNGLPAPEG